MTAGLLGRPSEQPTSSPSGVNRFGVVDRLTQLAPLHRRAALRRAQADAGLAGALPTIDELRTAVAPPAPVHRLARLSYDALPTREVLARETRRQLGDLAWRAGLPSLTRGEIEGRARRIAEERLAAAVRPGVREEYEIVNRDEVERGAALAAAHGPLLTALVSILDGLDDAVPRSVLAAVTDPDLCKIATDRATAAYHRWVARAGVAAAVGREHEEPTPDVRRTHCSLWQRRQVRRQSGEARQHLAAALGTVGRGGAPYADDYSLARWNERQAAQGAWAAERVLSGPDGITVPMVKVVASGQAAQQARMYAMMLGVDELAQRRDLTAVFATVTLPPEWHPGPAEGRRTWTPDRTPAMADNALRHAWARFRAILADRGVQTLGLRVWEPHKDGTPHMHALLYVLPAQVSMVDDALMTVCPEPRPGQRIASRMEVIDRKRASPASYVMKYILKAIAVVPDEKDRTPGAGEGVHDDEQLQHYERHRAVASERRWRRYAWLGVHGVQRVWQRLLTTKEMPNDAPERVQRAWMALHAGQWADALEALGAVGPRAQGIRLGYEEAETRYGDIARRAVRVVDLASGWTMPLTRQGWSVVKAECHKHEDTFQLTVVVSCPRAGAAPGLDAPGDGSPGTAGPPRGPPEASGAGHTIR